MVHRRLPASELPPSVDGLKGEHRAVRRRPCGHPWTTVWPSVDDRVAISTISACATWRTSAVLNSHKSGRPEKVWISGRTEKVLPSCHLLLDSRLFGLTLRLSAPVFRCHRVSWARGSWHLRRKPCVFLPLFFSNTKDLSLKQMFDTSARLVSEQDEIFGSETIGWENHSWIFMPFIGDKESSIFNAQRSTSFRIMYGVLAKSLRTPNRTMHGKLDWDGSNHLQFTKP